MISIVLLSFVCVSAASAENTNTFRNEYGSFDYKILPDGTACITGYLGFYNLVVIPAEIDGIKVSRIDDSAFYCSELVQKCYLDADGHEIFPAIPMSFHDKTGIVTPFWKDYYARRGLEVPEGEPGSNPGDLSRSRHLSILFRFF